MAVAIFMGCRQSDSLCRLYGSTDGTGAAEQNSQSRIRGAGTRRFFFLTGNHRSGIVIIIVIIIIVVIIVVITAAAAIISAKVPGHRLRLPMQH